MNKKNIMQLLGAIAFVGMVWQPAAQATIVQYTVDPISATDWRYNYTLINDSLGVNIDEFTIYFDEALYTNLVVDASPVDWDSLVVQPDNSIPANGFFDSLALIQGIQPGNILSGFSVTFTYLGFATPGTQVFEVVDSSFNVIDSGNTQKIPVVVGPPVIGIPEPSTYVMLVTGLAILCMFAGIRSHKGARGAVA